MDTPAMTLSLDLLLGFALFALVTSITPGPNNTMLLASGVNFGFNRTIPHMLGITCGFFSLVLAVGLGLGAMFQTRSEEHTSELLSLMRISYAVFCLKKQTTNTNT